MSASSAWPSRWALCVATCLVVGLLGTSEASASTIAPSRSTAAPSEEPPSVNALSSPSISPASGPLGGTRVRIRGAGFVGVEKVLFGGVAGRRLSTVGSSLVGVDAPTHTAGPVTVVVVTARTRIRVGTFTYMNRPVVTGLSPTSGSVVGGTRVTIQGRWFTSKATVYFGNSRATSVNLSGGSLHATAPPGAVGGVPVRVMTPGGKSQDKLLTRYSYVAPAPADQSSIAPSAGTYVSTGEGVTGVSGGPDESSPARPWTINLSGAVSQLPAVDQPFLLAPGAAIFPSGLAGVVASVADAGSGSTDVAVVPAAIDDVVDTAAVLFSGEASTPPIQGGASKPGVNSVDVTSVIDFGTVSSSSLSCVDSAKVERSLSAELGIKFENVHTHFEFQAGGLVTKPFLAAWISAEPVIYGNVSPNLSLTCKLTPLWQNTHKKIIPLGTSGATLSLAPAAELELKGKGTLEFSQHSYRMTGFITNPDGTLKNLSGASADPIRATASASVSVTAAVGAQLQFGFLDRIGIYGTIDVGGDITGTYEAIKVCLDAQMFLRARLGAFLDIFVKRWTYQALEFRVDLAHWQHCWPLYSSPVPAPVGLPRISTAALPSGVVGAPYSFSLHTADNRAGTWAVAGGSLPPGVSLTATSGLLSGVPNEVGSTSFSVSFVDSYGQQALASLQLAVADVGTPNPTTQVAMNSYSPAGAGTYVGRLADAKVIKFGLHISLIAQSSDGGLKLWSDDKLSSGQYLLTASGVRSVVTLKGTPIRFDLEGSAIWSVTPAGAEWRYDIGSRRSTLIRYFRTSLLGQSIARDVSADGRTLAFSVLRRDGRTADIWVCTSTCRNNLTLNRSGKDALFPVISLNDAANQLAFVQSLRPTFSGSGAIYPAHQWLRVVNLTGNAFSTFRYTYDERSNYVAEVHWHGSMWTVIEGYWCPLYSNIYVRTLSPANESTYLATFTSPMAFAGSDVLLGGNVQLPSA